MKYRGWKFNTKIGRLSCKVITFFGVLMMKLARKCFMFTLGRCSWCGSDCGFDSTISSKGKRCVSLYRNCEEPK